MAVIDISTLQDEAIKYQPELRYLPYAMLGPTLAELEINMLEVDYVLKSKTFQRKSGIAKPYDPTNLSNSDLGKVVEMPLQVYTGYSSVKDSIKNYQAKPIINVSQKGVNQTKNHPVMRAVHIPQMIRTYGEDLLDALFAAEYDVADQTPTGMFDGYDTIIDDFVTATSISVALKNMVNTGDISAAKDISDVYTIDKVVTFVKAAHPALRANAVLYMTEQTLFLCQEGLEAKLTYRDVDLAYVEKYINSKCNSRVRVIATPFMGTGERIILSAPRNFDFGMNTFGDFSFVQVRNPYEDPNLFQLWIQSDQGARINDIHRKAFQVNERSATHVAWSADY